MTYDAANGIAVLLAFACAAHVRARQAAVVLWAVFALNWLHYVSSYSDHSLAALLWSHHVMVTNDALWKVADALTGVAALVVAATRDRSLGLSIYALSIAQLLLHGSFWEGGLIGQAVYYPALDTLFWAQVAAFILVGGGGIVARVGRFLDWCRDAGRSRASASEQ